MKDTKFHYKDKVKIINGFFKGMRGIVKDISRMSTNRYWVHLSFVKQELIEEDDMELVE